MEENINIGDFMSKLLSNSYIMDLIDKISETLFKKYTTYKKVERYIKRWQEVVRYEQYSYEEPEPIYNFYPIYKDDNREKIDVENTLNQISDELIIQIAIDLKIEVQGVIYSIAKIEGLDKTDYQQAKNIFEDAIKKVYDRPDEAIGYANSALESIIKHILEQGKLDVAYNKKDTLCDLTKKILKGLNYYPSKDVEEKIRQIGSSLLNISQSIEELRSDKTKIHGKDSSQYIIEDPLYACFIVNSVATIGNFLISFYEKNYNEQIDKQHSSEYGNDGDVISENEVPF